MKRCYDKDVSFNGDYIHDIWLVKIDAEHPDNRIDIIAAQCNGNVKFIMIKQGVFHSFAVNHQISSVVALGTRILVTTQNCETFGFECIPGSAEIRELGKVINEPVFFIRKYHKVIELD